MDTYIEDTNTQPPHPSVEYDEFHTVNLEAGLPHTQTVSPLLYYNSRLVSGPQPLAYDGTPSRASPESQGSLTGAPRTSTGRVRTYLSLGLLAGDLLEQFRGEFDQNVATLSNTLARMHPRYSRYTRYPRPRRMGDEEMGDQEMGILDRHPRCSRDTRYPRRDRIGDEVMGRLDRGAWRVGRHGDDTA